VDEETCQKCRRQQLRQGKVPPCSTECLITFRPKVKLTYAQYQILQKLMDYCNTGELDEKDPATREMIIMFRQKVIEYVNMVRELKKKKNG